MSLSTRKQAKKNISIVSEDRGNAAVVELSL